MLLHITTPFLLRTSTNLPSPTFYGSSATLHLPCPLPLQLKTLSPSASALLHPHHLVPSTPFPHPYTAATSKSCLITPTTLPCLVPFLIPLLTPLTHTWPVESPLSHLRAQSSPCFFSPSTWYSQLNALLALIPLMLSPPLQLFSLLGPVRLYLITLPLPLLP